MEMIEAEFADLLKEDIQLPSRSSTFFDIAGLTYSEKVFSNLYAYYLNPIADHGLRDLFLNALCVLVTEKTAQPTLENTMWAIVQTEVCTNMGNFIDLVVIEPLEGSSIAGHAIIIENKINALLYNDLKDYFDYIDVHGRKVGVVLSLRKEVPAHPGYVNITHSELIAKVEEKLSNIWGELNARQVFWLKEFITHIQSFSMVEDLTSQYAFYFQYEEKIRSISRLEQTIKADMFTQLSVACIELGLKLGAPYHSSLRYFFSQTCPVCFTIWMPEVFTSRHRLTIIVELNKQGMTYLENINEIDFTPEEMKLIKEKTRVRGTYLHYATLSFDLIPKELQQFSTCVYQKILTTPLYNIFRKIEDKILHITQSQVLP
ncbi:PD-(D/E)XK nuclease family protein [Chitinophaga sp.]|uniref:PD-(D/E)XK nuclease family protein n=1 Tax=Chitinophaga sp. TaxID=1869181 RepID=UPI0031DDF190